MWRDPGVSADSFYETKPDCTDVPISRFKIKAGKTLSPRKWHAALSQEGYLDIGRTLRRIYRGGVHPSIRGEVWEFLLGCYDPKSTFDERDQIRQRRRRQYATWKEECRQLFPLVGSGRFITSPVITDDGQPIQDPMVMPETNPANGLAVLPQDNNRISSINSASISENVTDKKLIQWMLTLHQIGLDVVRTDRTLVFYEKQENLSKLWDILAVYAWIDKEVGYGQGMSDLCSPMIILLDDEADAFWCFERLMRRLRGNFRCVGRTLGVEAQLSNLASITQVVDPKLHKHIEHIGGGDYVFDFRMLMVLFRREFSFCDSLYLWEMMWALEYDPSMFLMYEEAQSASENPEGFKGKAKSTRQCGKYERQNMRNGAKNAESPLPISVFLVASVLKDKSTKLLDEARGLDDVVKILNDTTGNLDAKKACTEAMKLHKKYLRKPGGMNSLLGVGHSCSMIHIEDLGEGGGGAVSKSKNEFEVGRDANLLAVYNLDPPQGCKLGEEVSILWQRLISPYICGCVFPMKVRLTLDVAPYAVFPVMTELEYEVALGTYLEQSQVVIMGATADNQNQGRTIVDINLVPLGEKFDNTTAALTYERFWHKKVPLNRSIFGDYAVAYITFPGIPSSPPYETSIGSGPSQNADGSLPVSADFASKNQKMNLRTIIIIASSSSVTLKWRKTRGPSSAVGPAFTSSLNKRSGLGSMLSSSITSSTSMSLMSTMPTSILSVKTFLLSEIEKATNKFNSKRVLGEGGFGRGYSGTLEDGAEVAVKLLTRDNNQNGDREFIAEVEMLSRLHHRNLVKLIGICIEGRKRCLVYELVPNGSVESHLHGDDKNRGPLDWEARMKIALGAARGLAYLHEDSNPRVIHRDFKASNVLLEDDFTPKVSDFGLAREATEGSNHISTRVMGTFGYVAPEYAMTGHLLVKSDVYSYGVVLLELLTGRKPVDMSQPQGQENLVTWARTLLTSREGLEQLVDPSLAGSYNFDDMAKVAAIASMCVHSEVTQRPFMGEVVQALKLIYNDTDETGGDYCSQKDSSAQESDFRGELAPSDSSWWNGGGLTPRLTYGQASSFITMEYSSGPLEDMENRPFSTSSFNGDELSLPIRHGNRSGPLRTIRSKLSLYRFSGSRSEHGELSSKRNWI